MRMRSQGDSSVGRDDRRRRDVLQGESVIPDLSILSVLIIC